MLYLVMGFDKDENDNLIKLIKIGFSDNLNTRENQYKSSGILMGFMKTREGDKNLEKAFHIYFSKYKYEKLNEWFYYNEDIIINFEMPEKTVYKSLWEYLLSSDKINDFTLKIAKENINLLDKSNVFHKKILKKLKENNLEPIKITESIQNEDKKSTLNETIINNINSKLKHFRKLLFSEKIKIICELLDKYSDYKEIITNTLSKKDKILVSYWEFFGTNGCFKRQYKEQFLKEEYEVYLKKLKKADLVSKLFTKPEGYTIKEIEELIKPYEILHLASKNRFSKKYLDFIGKVQKIKDKYTIFPRYPSKKATL